MELRERTCGYIDAWKYTQGTPQIPTPRTKNQQYAPHTWTPPVYGQKVQHGLPPETLPVLDKKGTKRVQSVTGTFQYRTRAIDPTMIVAVNELASEQSALTAKTIKKFKMLLDYTHTYPDPKIRYHASDMCLHLDSDAAYLFQPKARSRVTGHYYLSNRIPQETKTPDPKPNSPIHTECKTIRNVMSSVVEVETIGVFSQCKNCSPNKDYIELIKTSVTTYTNKDRQQYIQCHHNITY